MLNDSNPILTKSSALSLKALADAERTKAKYDPTIVAGLQYQRSSEDAIVPVQPIFDPQTSINIGLRKNFQYGVVLQADAFANQVTSQDGSIKDATQVGFRLQAEFDLWKNFLGRLSQAEFQSAEAQTKVASLQKKIDRRSLLTNIRKLYWELVSVESSIRLSQRLVQSAQKQYSDTRKRRADYVADKGDVARSKAQVLSRKSSEQFLELRHQILKNKLSDLIPELHSMDWHVYTEQITARTAQANTCISKINSDVSVDQKYSYFPSIIDLIGEKSRSDLKLASSVSQLDLKVVGKFQTSEIGRAHV